MGKFGRKCKRSGGLFKCCVTLLCLTTFEDSRNKLIKEKLIKARPTSFCKSRPDGSLPCCVCTAEAACVKRNEETGQVTNTSRTRYKREHKVAMHLTTSPNNCKACLLTSCLGWWTLPVLQVTSRSEV